VKEVYLDLSDKIFIHKDFVEVVWKKHFNKRALLKFLEEFTDMERYNIKFRVSEWKGDVLEEVLIEPFELSLLILSKRIVNFG
jgi:hypothetical protein